MTTGEHLAELLEHTDVRSLRDLRNLRAAINAQEDFIMSGPEQLQNDLFGGNHEAAHIN